MKTIHLENNSLWKWLDINKSSDENNINALLEAIVKTQHIEPGYLIELIRDGNHPKNSNIMDNLSQYVPRKYFLEIQYCAAVYASVFGKIFPPFASEIEQLAYIEWLLYTEPGYTGYRDHLVHMFKVAFCGHRFLSVPTLFQKIVDFQFKSTHFIDWCKEEKIRIDLWKDHEKENVVKIAFLLAALFHDFGYGYFFLSKYKERLFSLCQWLLLKADATELNTVATQTLLKSLPAFFIRKNHAWLSKQNKYYQNADNVIAGFFHDCLPLNHSIASTFFILDLTEKLQKARALSEELYVAFQLAAEACMIHDMTGNQNWLHLKTKQNGHFIDCNDHKNIPLAMLLIFSDELSVWKRPTLKPEISKNGKNGISYFLDDGSTPEKIEISITERKKKNTIKITPINDQKETISKAFEKIKCLKKQDNSDPQLSQLLDYEISVIKNDLGQKK